MKNRIKRMLIVVVFSVYLLSNFFQSFFFVGNNRAYALENMENQINYTNIVAIIVDNKIYNTIKDDVEWYATKYIQGDGVNNYVSISNSKALVFPINVESFSAKNITQLLENIYFDGIKGESSKLIGVVLIGDIPLPVVNQDGYIYPTIYPYVDFENQKFIWNDEIKYFVYNDNPKGQAEIWHGIINFEDNVEDYKNYFNKLKEYNNNPSEYISKAIWYEDFIGNNKYFNEDNLNFYLNNFIFAEDLGYHRYSDLMIKVLQGQRNNEVLEIINSLNELNSGFNTTEGFEILHDLDNSINTPTMQIKSVIDNGYLSKYSSLFGQKYLKTIKNNIETANRWIESRTGSNGSQYYIDAFDSSYTKAGVADEVLLRSEGQLEPFIIMLNNALENAVDKKVNDEKYWLNEVLPLTYLQYSGRSRWLGKCVWDVYNAYENYYFGENSRFLQSMEDTTTYRGTYRNYTAIDGLTIQDIQNSENPSTDISGLDLNKKSVGGSYEIFATQVDANRGYNYYNSVNEYEVYSGNKTAKMENRDVTCVKKILGICVKRRWNISSNNGSGCDLGDDGDQGGCENQIEYSTRIWGGASPLNLDVNGIEFTRKSGYFYTGAVSPVFDIAGSVSVTAPEYESDSFKSIDKYSNLTLRKFSPDTSWPKFKSANPNKQDPAPYGFGYDYSMDYDVKFTNQIPVFNRNSIDGWMYISPKIAGDVNYFEKYDLNAKIEGDVIKIEKRIPGGDEACKGKGEIYTYRTLDSRVKNDSVNADELNGYSYEIFKDNRSHVKQFYLEILSFLDAISGSVNTIVGSDSGSLQNNLISIKSTIDSINSGFDGILNLGIDEISQMSTGLLETTAQQWSYVLNSNIYEYLLSKIKDSQNSVLMLSGFVDAGDGLFMGLSDFIEKEKSRFAANGWNLIFYDGRKLNIYTQIKDILENYLKLKQIIIEDAAIFFSINDIGEKTILGVPVPISMNIVDNLLEKKEQINSLQNGSGCIMNYRSLCDSLDTLINNYDVYVENINSEKDGINDLKVYEVDDDGGPTDIYSIINNIFLKLELSSIFQHIDDESILQSFYDDYIDNIIGTGNENMLGFSQGMNQTTSDRPIDSPRYLTFKGIGGDKISFIYPDLYKAEIFSGDDNVLTLKSTGEIAESIKNYLRTVVGKYNEYLVKQAQLHTNYYNQNNAAYDFLATVDPLASPYFLGDDTRPYRLFEEDYLITWLEDSIINSPYFYNESLAKQDPIGFIANMIYYQNITWPVKTVSSTINGDFDNQRVDFDINQKVGYLLDNYLIKDNNKGIYLTPDYRENGYEVAFINSDGNDLILYENTPEILETIQAFSDSYSTPVVQNVNESELGQELLNECNIPEEGGVLLFQMSGGLIETPRFDALKCWREKVKDKPFQFKIKFPFTRDTGVSFWDNVGTIFDRNSYKDIWMTYIDQIKLLDTEFVNNKILGEIEMSSPGDMAKLQETLSYTMIEEKKSTISADNPENKITIYSSKSLGNIEFNIVNVGASKIKLSDENNVISNNITLGTGGFSTGKIIFDPYTQKNLDIELENPIDGMNILIFYMCLPGTQNVEKCVRKSLRLDVVPGALKEISLSFDSDIVLEGGKMPFKVFGKDKYGNEVGELITQKFYAMASSGLLDLNGYTSNNIQFSNFDKANFELFATGGSLDGKEIIVQVSGSLDGVPGVKASESVNVVNGRLDAYSDSVRLSSGGTIITGKFIELPDKDIYFLNNQINKETVPSITIKLLDSNNNIIDIDGYISVKAKNNNISIGNIEEIVGGNLSGQYKFYKTDLVELSGGVAQIYLLPNFSAGENVVYISMQGVETIELPIYVKHASPRIVTLSVDDTILDQNASTNASLKVFDNRYNIVEDDDMFVVLGTVNDKISLSNSGNIRVNNGSYDFTVVAQGSRGLGYIFAYIHTGIVPMDKQRPASQKITVQANMLPVSNLNVMYLNLFGNDRGNQWGYMSKNKKYSENLIKNSEKLISVTTQLIGYDNIKNFPIVIDSGLQIQSSLSNSINFMSKSGWLIDINSIGEIRLLSNNFKLEEVRISEDSLEMYISQMMSGNLQNKNVLFYIPEQTDSIIEQNEIENGSIYINNKKVFDLRSNTFDKNLIISLGNDKIAGYQVWNVYISSSFVGRLLFAVGNKDTISLQLVSKSLKYGIDNTWLNGSTKEYGLGFYLLDSKISDKTFGYKSIQDSYNPILGIGFTSNFKNITNFGGGMSVGESTVPFGSELLINIGDPLLKRVDENESAKIYDGNGNIKIDTEFDLGLGEIVYSEPNKDILKVINIDFNNDGLNDIMVVFTDGTIKLLKNYGGTDPFKDLGDLMVLADRIKDVSIGDVDGNGYQDIIVWTHVGGLRVYLNDKGIFDVDGYPICLNINVDKGEVSDHPENILDAHQIFLEDMDLDGILDIITNDKLGFIKIFYGGKIDGEINYLSTNKYMCDDGWYDRIEGNMNTVYQFGIKVDNVAHVLDKSLVHRLGVGDEGSGSIQPEDVGVNSAQLRGDLNMVLDGLSHFNVSDAELSYMGKERFKQSGFGVIPIYESGIDNESNIDYIEIGSLTGSDPIKIYKVYEDLNDNSIESDQIDTVGSLVKGDLVRVSVYIEANDNFTGTFIDKIIGPWTIPLSEYNDETFENFWFDPTYITMGYITSGQIETITRNIHWDLENNMYMLDNIIMKRGDKLKFSYGLIYNGYNAFDIDISPLTGNNFSGVVMPRENLDRYSYDDYPDISVQPVDGCNDSMFVFFNNGSSITKRDYVEKFMDLGKIKYEYNESSQQNYEGTIYESMQSWGNMANSGDIQGLSSQISSFTDFLEVLDWKGMLENQGILENFSNIGNTIIGSEFVNNLTNNVVKKIDDTIGGLCNGIDLSSLGLGSQGGCGLPVPFNQAFLGVGKYHVFGCYEIPFLSETIGKGMPVLHAPAMWGTYPAVGFFGLPSYGPTENFFGLGAKSTLDSRFRLYLMPTLTLDLGIALCFGPYTVGNNIPDPRGSIAGNCVVFSIPLPCGNSNANNLGLNATTDIPYEYTLLKGCNKQNNPVFLEDGESSTPFTFVGSSLNSNTFQPIIPDGSYAGGFINIEISPDSSVSYKEKSSINIDDIILEGGAKIQNQVQGSKDQGLIDMLVKKWFDKQIKYIMSNLTNFKVSVMFPDFGGLLGKIPTVNEVQSAIESIEEKQKKCELNKGEWIDDPDIAKKVCDLGQMYCCKDTVSSLQLKCENRGMKRDANGSICKASDSSLSQLDAWGQENLLTKDQISSRSEYMNPIANIEKAFEETPLINISSENIVVNVPMLTSEDITSYISMSQSWLNRQSEILEDWQLFFESLIGVCGGSTNINGIEDIGNAINEMKEIYKDSRQYSQTTGDEQLLQNLQAKINALEILKKSYNLSDLGDYKVYEAKNGGFYVYSKFFDGVNNIVPYDVYLYFDPGTSNLSMFTSGFDLIVSNVSSDSVGKSKISIQRNTQEISNTGLQIKTENEDIYHYCGDIFLDGTIDVALKGFLNIQSNANSLMLSVKENIETLQQYKLFPMQLYEWIHVTEKYLGETTDLINSILGYLSFWIETNANRFSQYVDSIITLMTVLETYQLIMDLSVDWSENCSTCTNDNYDQFSCKLSGICDILGIELPVIEIPPVKIPSLYLDFSNINLETDIKLPNFEFNTISVSLPDLPDLPLPPDIDLSLNLDDAIKFGLNFLQELKLINFEKYSSMNIGNIPLIPSPPVLPDLPSFIPSVEMELPLMPPAPKIPKLPNEITNTIKAAKIVGKILCIIKGKFGLVAENTIKAKVEQITQRDYEIPFRDNFDQTFSEWNAVTMAKLPAPLANIFTGFSALLQANEFKKAKLKGFDLSLETYINLQFNFDYFYEFLNLVVGKINEFTYDITNFTNTDLNLVSSISGKYIKRLQACVNNPISIDCNPDAYDQINEYNDILKKVERYKLLLNSSFNGLDEILTKLENKKDELQGLEVLINELQEELSLRNKELIENQNKLSNTVNDVDRQRFLDAIQYLQNIINNIQLQIDENQEKIDHLQQEISELNDGYGSAISAYNELKILFEDLSQNLGVLEGHLLDMGNNIIEQINSEIKSAGEDINYAEFSGLMYDFSSGLDKSNEQKDKNRQERLENLQNIYKDVNVVSYVDYDPEINSNNFAILGNMLKEIDQQAINKNIKDRAQEYLSLISLNRKINLNDESIDRVKSQYNVVVSNYLQDNKELMNLLESDYNEFLLAISNNQFSLVNDDSIDITLSANLFDIENDTISAISQKDNLLKKYIDYNMNNVNGYLNALENYSAQELNMDENVYKFNKNYLNKIKLLSNEAYKIIEDGQGSIDSGKFIGDKKTLLAQSAGGLVQSNPDSDGFLNNTVDIANYIQGYTLNTKDGIFLLANNDYVNQFQSRFVLSDINGDNHSDLILWDNNNVYIKYRLGNSDYDNTKYDDSSRFYVFEINSYDELVSQTENGFAKIRYGGVIIPKNIYVKVVDTNWEVKNFEHVGQSFDTIKISWLNSYNLGDDVDGYLVKMIHRIDQFNDKEFIATQSNNDAFWGKKYVLVLPEGSDIAGKGLEIEEGILNNIEELIGTGNKIFSLSYYSASDNKINLTIQDLPRNWQYSEILTLNLDGDVYKISSSSSNQAVAGPQIIADTKGPNAKISLYRPATDEIVSEGVLLEGFVGTNYTLKVDREDNVSLDEIWIADELGNRIVEKKNISRQTGYIEYSGLYFTGEQFFTFYLGGVDIDGNRYVTDAKLNIKIPTIQISKVGRGESTLGYLNNNIVDNSFLPNISLNGNNEYFSNTIVAQLNQDIDSGFVQFLRNRVNDKWEILTGTIGGRNVSYFETLPGQVEITGGYFDLGDDIGLYSSSGGMVAKINPRNGNITIMPGFENIIDIKLDYSPKVPILKVMEGSNTLFWVVFSSRELSDPGLTINSNGVSVISLDDESFGPFYGGNAIIQNGQIILYVSPIGQMYTDIPLYGEYRFDSITDSVIYTFRTDPIGQNLGSVKFKIKNLLEY